MYKLWEPANYEPEPESSFEAIAKRQNISPQEVAYDCLLEKEGNYTQKKYFFHLIKFFF